MAGIAANLQDGNFGDSHDETALSLSEGNNDGIEENAIMAHPIVTSYGVTLNPKTDGTISRINFIMLSEKPNLKKNATI